MQSCVAHSSGCVLLHAALVWQRLQHEPVTQPVAASGEHPALLAASTAPHPVCHFCIQYAYHDHHIMTVVIIVAFCCSRNLHAMYASVGLLLRAPLNPQLSVLCILQMTAVDMLGLPGLTILTSFAAHSASAALHPAWFCHRHTKYDVCQDNM